MKQNRFLRMLTLTTVLLLVGGLTQAAESWTEDYEAAKKLAAEQKKDLFINVSGSDWCGWCQKLDKEVFGQDVFVQQATQDYVLVHLDFPRKTEQDPKIKAQNEALLKMLTEKYGFPGYPTVYLANAEGKVYARTGYVEGGAQTYLEHLRFLKKAQPYVDPGATWIEDFEVAKAKAAALNKDLLINFSGSNWCMWCIRLDKEVFEKVVFQRKASQDFIFVKLDFPQPSSQAAWLKAQNQKLSQEFSQKYGFQGYPTVYLAHPSGVPYQKTGYESGGPEVYLKILKELQKSKKVAG